MRAAKKAILCLTLFGAYPITAYRKSEPWTHCYTFFSNQTDLYNRHMPDNEKINTLKLSNRFAQKLMPFTQLIFSWNASRPKQGFFRFLVRTQNDTSNQWSVWHKMAEWGKDIQRSFSDKKSNHRSCYNFAHLDLIECATFFEIKIEALDGSSIKDIKSLNVCICQLEKMNNEQAQLINKNMSSINIRGIPRYSQMTLNHPDNKVVCSPTATSMLVAYLLKKKIHATKFADNSYDDGLKAYGNWPFNTAHAFELCENNFFFSVRRLQSFAILHQLLREQIPVVVSIRGHLKNAPQSYPNGHLLLVVGYDARKKTVICHDPAQPNNAKVLTRYCLSDFLKAWERSYRLAYTATKKGD